MFQLSRQAWTAFLLLTKAIKRTAYFYGRSGYTCVLINKLTAALEAYCQNNHASNTTEPWSVGYQQVASVSLNVNLTTNLLPRPLVENHVSILSEKQPVM